MEKLARAGMINANEEITKQHETSSIKSTSSRNNKAVMTNGQLGSAELRLPGSGEKLLPGRQPVALIRNSREMVTLLSPSATATVNDFSSPTRNSVPTWRSPESSKCFAKLLQLLWAHS
ncbi:hypothetical protein R1flu_028510 [Riccia fluitans]|uniref:Uncharacterized protein n=1 Tax=Riccia fluitans TaxID=41844 RepID=A0ABD1XLW2_9MARC